MFTDLQTDLNALEDAHSSGVTIKRDLQIVRGSGTTVWDETGRAYIDLVAGQGSASLGHSHPAVVAAITAQASELMTCTEIFHTPTRARYQAALCAAANMTRVFLCNSGTEANEAALKFAHLTTGRTGVVSTMRGFHGRTIGALGATWEKHYREPFNAWVPEATFVPYNNLERMAEAITDQTAAVIVEAVQGEGGVHPAAEGYLQGVQALCRERGALLIIDEVQTGFGRTGTLFTHQQDGIEPDILTVAKSMAGGLPMGAALLSERVGSLQPAAHGSTFGGNPLACAAALAVLETLQTTDLIDRARTRGEAVRAHLREHLPETVVRDVRGRGLMIGIELRGKVAPVLRALQARGVLALPAGINVLRLLPPLVIEDEQLWEAVSIIEEVIPNAV